VSASGYALVSNIWPMNDTSDLFQSRYSPAPYDTDVVYQWNQGTQSYNTPKAYFNPNDCWTNSIPLTRITEPCWLLGHTSTKIMPYNYKVQ